jgi:hypothetical protein
MYGDSSNPNVPYHEESISPSKTVTATHLSENRAVKYNVKRQFPFRTKKSKIETPE